MNKALQTFIILVGGIFLLNTSVNASVVCSSKDLAEFKRLYIELQKQLNYEGKDAYLDSRGVVQLKAHAKEAPYPGKVFEDALYSEYQNSLRKVGRLYQLSKFEGDDSFKSNPTLLKFMEAIEDKGSASTDFVSKTKIDDVIDALEAASKKKFAGTNDKKFILSSGDKYLLKKLLTHAQDRICSVKKYEDTGKGTAHFNANYLQQVKNAPLNRLVNSLKSAQIGKDSKIDLKASTLDLVDEDVAIKSAVSEHVTNLSNWVKSNKDKCLTAIKSKPFMNSIQSNIQGCNYLQFIDSLNQESFNKLEAVMHFINANERFLKNGQAKAETSLDELKLEGYIGKAFDNLGTQIRCTQISSNTTKDKKVFVRNLPYDEATNKFDTSSIVCKSKGKELSAIACKGQYDLISDDLGRGLEIKPKKGIPAGLSFSVKDAGNCNDIDLVSDQEKECSKKKENGFIFTWDSEKKDCLKINADKDPKKTCEIQKKKGSIFIWDDKGKTCDEMPSEPFKKACEVQKKEGFTFKWDEESTPPCVETPILKETKITCEAKKKEGFTYNWDEQKSECTETPVLKETKAACEAKKKDGFIYKWDEQKSECSETPVLKETKAACEAKKKDGFIYKWDEQKSECTETPDPKETKVTCEAKKKEGFNYNWDEQKSECTETPALTETKASCEEKTEDGFTFSWNEEKKSCDKKPIIDPKKACEEQVKEGASFIWNLGTNKCEEVPVLVEEKQCTDKKEEGFTFTWNKEKKECVKTENKKEDKKPDVDGATKCMEKNKEWIEKSNDGVRQVKYQWDGKECKDIRPDTSKRTVDDNEEDPGTIGTPAAPKAAPPRFTPVNIPTRQMYVLPGMP